MVTEEEANSILSLQKMLMVPDEIAYPILQRLSYLRYITHIRQGNLPTVQTRLRLESDELSHLETPATYHKVNSKSTSLIHG